MAAKNKGDSGAGRSNKIRVFYFEGDVSDTSVSELAQLFNSAVRSAAAPASPRLASGRPVAALGNGNGIEEEEIFADVEETQDEETSAAPARAERKVKERKPVKREILKDVDLSGGEVPFEGFMASKGNPAETSKRFMVIAAWYNLHGKTTEITVNHVYTAYRDVGLNLEVKDVGQVFRDLKGQGWGDYKARKFEINDIGLKVVKKMNAEGANEPA